MTDTVSFANDIAPVLYQYQGPMAWRFDLTNPEHVRANFDAIWGQITTTPPSMPPPPFPPFTQAFVDKLAAWKAGGWAP